MFRNYDPITVEYIFNFIQNSVDRYLLQKWGIYPLSGLSKSNILKLMFSVVSYLLTAMINI